MGRQPIFAGAWGGREKKEKFFPPILTAAPFQPRQERKHDRHVSAIRIAGTQWEEDTARSRTKTEKEAFCSLA